MRLEVLFAVPLIVTSAVAVPMRAQRITSRATSPNAGQPAPLISDSLSARMRVLGLLLSPSPTAYRVVFVDTTQGGLECPMPILQPDSAKRFAAIKSEPLHSNDRMPTRASACSNPLAKSRTSP